MRFHLNLKIPLSDVERGSKSPKTSLISRQKLCNLSTTVQNAATGFFYQNTSLHSGTRVNNPERLIWWASKTEKYLRSPLAAVFITVARYSAFHPIPSVARGVLSFFPTQIRLTAICFVVALQSLFDLVVALTSTAIAGVSLITSAVCRLIVFVSHARVGVRTGTVVALPVSIFYRRVDRLGNTFAHQTATNRTDNSAYNCSHRSAHRTADRSTRSTRTRRTNTGSYWMSPFFPGKWVEVSIRFMYRFFVIAHDIFFLLSNCNYY